MSQRKKSVSDIDLAGERIFLRVDYNVPTDAKGEISDDSRIAESLPTIHYLLERGCSIVVACHFGRPKGKIVEELRVAALRRRLSELVGADIVDLGGPSGAETSEMARSLQRGEIGILENLRFDPREESNDPKFASELANMADIFVNDAFGTAHRAHASTEGIARLLPAVSGLLMSRELEMLGRVIEVPESPVVAIVGGAKVTDKIAILRNLTSKVDAVLIGGGMVAAFAEAKGFESGRAEVSAEEIEAAEAILADSSALILLPEDVVTAASFDENAVATVRPFDSVDANALILDIGPASVTAYSKVIEDARTIVWNGPPGVFEWESFSGGTRGLAQAVASNTSAITIVGGGSTAEAVHSLGLAGKMTHISTGGGASLEFLEGKTLPGVAALNDI
ncbi:MAG: phosphoglycerate kinase [Chloroflexi bacterium]|nr:phosphoglycerate kinase [Chloroflexota bacterium]